MILRTLIVGDAYEVPAGVPQRSDTLASDTVTLIVWSADRGYTVAGCVYGDKPSGLSCGKLSSKVEAAAKLSQLLSEHSIPAVVAANELRNELQVVEWARQISNPEQWCHKVLEVA